MLTSTTFTYSGSTVTLRGGYTATVRKVGSNNYYDYWTPSMTITDGVLTIRPVASGTNNVLVPGVTYYLCKVKGA